MAAKVFEVNDVLPATTQLRIIAPIPGLGWHQSGGAYTTNEYLRVYAYDDDDGADYDFRVKVNGSYLNLSNYNLSKLVDNEWVSCEDVEYTTMSVIIDTSTWTETQRTIVDCSHPIYWEDLNAPSFTITFEENGGTNVTDLTEQTNLPTPLPATTKSGYKFVNWYYESNFQTRAKAGDTIEANTTLYAKWHNLGSLFTEIADAIRSKDGTSENIRDLDFGERVKQIQGAKELTQAQYDALGTKDTNTYYLIVEEE